MAEGRFDRLDEIRQLTHVLRARLNPTSARQVGANPAQPKRGQAEDMADDFAQIRGHDAFAEVSELHHEHHVMDLPRGPSGRSEF